MNSLFVIIPASFSLILFLGNPFLYCISKNKKTIFFLKVMNWFYLKKQKNAACILFFYSYNYITLEFGTILSNGILNKRQILVYVKKRTNDQREKEWTKISYEDREMYFLKNSVRLMAREKNHFKTTRIFFFINRLT